jgi:hypothetical protein
MADLGDGESVEVKGSGARTYVLRDVGGVCSCSCPAWRNQSVPIERRTCKHLCRLRGDESERARFGRPPRYAAYRPRTPARRMAHLPILHDARPVVPSRSGCLRRSSYCLATPDLAAGMTVAWTPTAGPLSVAGRSLVARQPPPGGGRLTDGWAAGRVVADGRARRAEVRPGVLDAPVGRQAPGSSFWIRTIRS